MAMDDDFARWFTSKVSFENEIPYYRSRNPPPPKNWEFWWVPRRMTMSQEVSARILSLETPRFAVANEGLDWDSRTLKMFHNSDADERLHPRWWEHSNSHWLHEDHITGPSNFPVFWPVSFFGPWDQVQWMWWCWTQPSVLASVEVKLADVYGLVDGGCVPRFLFCKFPAVFLKGKASPPFFAIWKGALDE